MLETITENRIVQLRLKNTHSVPLELWLEPEGCQYDMPAQAEFLIDAKGPPDEHGLEIEFSPGRVTVWGWQGAIVSIYHQGRELTAPQKKA